jgi:protein disulfide-isomerase
MPSRTSILETIPLVISDPPKLRSKSTIGFFEATFFHTWSFITNHPVWSAIILVISSIAAYIAHRRRILRRGVSGYGGSTGGGILGYGTGTGGNVGGGFFRLDGKEGLLNGGSAGKVD